MKLVVAGNYAQYKHYLYDEGLTPTEAKYVSNPEMLQGYVDTEVEIILYGSWWESPACEAAQRLRDQLRNVKN